MAIDPAGPPRPCLFTSLFGLRSQENIPALAFDSFLKILLISQTTMEERGLGVYPRLIIKTLTAGNLSFIK
jgi:hypothetical protein